MEELPLAPSSFDLVLASGSLHYVHHLPRALVELRRVTRKGGLLLVLDSPIYRRRQDGEAMVADRMKALERRYGLPDPAREPVLLSGAGRAARRVLIRGLDARGPRLAGPAARGVARRRRRSSATAAAPRASRSCWRGAMASGAAAAALAFDRVAPAYDESFGRNPAGLALPARVPGAPATAVPRGRSRARPGVRHRRRRAVPGVPGCPRARARHRTRDGRAHPGKGGARRPGRSGPRRGARGRGRRVRRKRLRRRLLGLRRAQLRGAGRGGRGSGARAAAGCAADRERHRPLAAARAPRARVRGNGSRAKPFAPGGRPGAADALPHRRGAVRGARPRLRVARRVRAGGARCRDRRSEAWIARHPLAFGALAAVERLVRGWPGCATWATTSWSEGTRR